MRINDLIEMAVPSKELLEGILYHGTSKESYAMSIIEHGIDTRMVDLKYGGKRKLQRPMDSRVYLTPDIGYAACYAQGGYWFNGDADPKTKHSPPEWLTDDGEDGYIFEVSGSQLVDVQPDEDSVGHMMTRWIRQDHGFIDGLSDSDRLQLGRLARLLTTSLIKGLKSGFINDEIRVGKFLLNKDRMTDSDKRMFIRLGAHVAHLGTLRPTAVHVFDKMEAYRSVSRDGHDIMKVCRTVEL